MWQEPCVMLVHMYATSKSQRSTTLLQGHSHCGVRVAAPQSLQDNLAIPTLGTHQSGSKLAYAPPGDSRQEA